MRDLCKSSLLYFLSVTGPWDSRLLPYFVESSVGLFSALTSNCGYWNVLTIRRAHQPCAYLVIEHVHQPRKAGAVRSIVHIFLLFTHCVLRSQRFFQSPQGRGPVLLLSGISRALFEHNTLFSTQNPIFFYKMYFEKCHLTCSNTVIFPIKSGAALQLRSVSLLAVTG